MGVVVAATHTELGHRVAIKLLRDELAHSPVIVERFMREARSVVGLRTEHVCKVTDVGRLDSGAPFIVMELLEGVDLQRTVAKQPLPVTMAVEYVLQACIALAEAHAAGIIHRDLKPANLFVTRRLDGGPLVKVLDFGIAKAMHETLQLTHQSAMGSPGYMSPEQIQSARDVDVRTDIWALGVTLYQLLSARMPFPGSTPTEIAIKVANDPPAPLEVDPALRAVVWKCLEKQPAQRYATIGELITALAPFGGTAARAHISLAGQLGGFAVAAPVSFTPVPASVSGATVATQLTTGQAVVVAPTPAEPEPPRRRAWPLLVVSLALALVVGGGAAAMVWLKKPPAVAIADARPAVVATVTPDVAVTIDAAPVIDGDPWRSNDAPSIPSEEDEKAAKAARAEEAKNKPKLTYAQQLKIGAAMGRCQNVMKTAVSDPFGLQERLTKCMCGQKDHEAALLWISTMSGSNRSDAEVTCKELGVAVP
jgi:serine/threonine-protein kinase